MCNPPAKAWNANLLFCRLKSHFSRLCMLFLTLGVTKAVGYFVPHEVSLWLWAHTACLWGMTCQSSVLSHINLIQFSLWWAVHTFSHMRFRYGCGPILPFSSCCIRHDMPILCFVSHLVPLWWPVHNLFPMRSHWDGGLICPIRGPDMGWAFLLPFFLAWHTNLPPSSWIKSRFGIEILCLILCLCWPVLHLSSSSAGSNFE